MKTASPPLTVGLLAKSAGVNVETTRFYQRKGLLPEPAQPLADVRGKIAELSRIEGVLADLVERCCVARGKVRCPLIKELYGGI